MHDYRKLHVWAEAIDLVTAIYKLTDSFPKKEIYGITAQMRKCSVSIPSNIAEGAGRKTDGEFIVFLGYSNGSCCELETQLIISKNIELIDIDTLNSFSEKLQRIEKMIFKLVESLKKE